MEGVDSENRIIRIINQSKSVCKNKLKKLINCNIHCGIKYSKMNLTEACKILGIDTNTDIRYC